MGECHDLRPLLGAHVLGALEPGEAARVREHVASCQACAAEHARLAPLPGLLTLAAGAEAVRADPPPAALEERLLDAVAAEPPMRRRPRRAFPRRRRLVVATGLATAALAAGLLATVLAGESEPAGYDVPLRAAAVVPHATAHAQLREVAGGTTMHLWVRGLPADRSAVYEVHCDSPAWSASAGTFRVSGDGTAYVELTTAARRGEYRAIRIVRRNDRRVVFTARLASGRTGGAARAYPKPS